MALSLAGAYALSLPLPYIAPIFALMLTIKPAPPMRLKSLFGLILLILFTTSTGLMLIPVLLNYPVTGLLIVAMGLFLGNYLSVNMGKGAVGALLTVGLTLISAAGLASFMVGRTVVVALILCLSLAVVCQYVVYAFFPEDAVPPTAPPKPETGDSDQSNWIALRATLIVFPAYMMGLINPGMYLPIIMKSVSLGQQGSITNVRHAGRELLSSTFAGGCFAVLFWFALDLVTNLWMFFLWMLIFSIYFSAKLYRVVPSRFPASFWMNTVITMLILLGPAVQDSANGKDVYKAFAVRMGLFVAVTFYAWAAIAVLEHLRTRRMDRIHQSLPAMEAN